MLRRLRSRSTIMFRTSSRTDLSQMLAIQMDLTNPMPVMEIMTKMKTDSKTQTGKLILLLYCNIYRAFTDIFSVYCCCFLNYSFSLNIFYIIEITISKNNGGVVFIRVVIDFLTYYVCFQRRLKKMWNKLYSVQNNSILLVSDL